MKYLTAEMMEYGNNNVLIIENLNLQELFCMEHQMLIPKEVLIPFRFFLICRGEDYSNINTITI